MSANKKNFNVKKVPLSIVHRVRKHKLWFVFQIKQSWSLRFHWTSRKHIITGKMQSIFGNPRMRDHLNAFCVRASQRSTELAWTCTNPSHFCSCPSHFRSCRSRHLKPALSHHQDRRCSTIAVITGLLTLVTPDGASPDKKEQPDARASFRKRRRRMATPVVA